MGSLNVPEKSDATVWPQQARDPVFSDISTDEGRVCRCRCKEKMIPGVLWESQ